MAMVLISLGLDLNETFTKLCNKVIIFFKKIYNLLIKKAVYYLIKKILDNDVKDKNIISFILFFAGKKMKKKNLKNSNYEKTMDLLKHVSKT